MRISDWSSDVCSSDLRNRVAPFVFTGIQILSPRLLVDAPEGPFSTNLFWDRAIAAERAYGLVHQGLWFDIGAPEAIQATEAVIGHGRSEEHTSELQSLMRISYAVFCLQKKKTK